MRARPMQRAIFVAGSLFASACSVIAGGGEPTSWRCSIEGGDDLCREVAPPGERYRCVVAAGETVGVCAMCATSDLCGNGLDDDCDDVVDNGSPETCNALDDDCDGAMDEGLDEDRDGYTWCPTGPPPMDCDDSNPSVRPTRDGTPPEPDICDGLDNDCNPGTTDGSGQCNPDTQDCDGLGARCVEVNCVTRPTLCSAEQFCNENAIPPTCEARDMTCFNPAFQCAEGLVCNPATAECVSQQPSGAACDHDAECESALCLPVQALRLVSGHAMDRNGICGRSCCSDTECDVGQRCWASGAGARACVPDTVLAMGTHGVPIPSVCASRADCGSGDECRITLDDAYDVGDRYSPSCGAGYIGRVSCSGSFDCFFSSALDSVCIDRTCQRAFCTGAGDCPTGICAGSECRESCGVSSDCGGGGVCSWVFVRSATAGRDDYLPACSYTSSGTGVRTAVCTTDNDCRDRTCVDRTGNPLPPEGTQMGCADTCCADASCQAGEQCRPIFVHGRWENHCLARPIFGRVAMGG